MRVSSRLSCVAVASIYFGLFGCGGDNSSSKDAGEKTDGGGGHGGKAATGGSGGSAAVGGGAGSPAGGAAGGGSGAVGGAAGKGSKDGGTTDGSSLDLSGITPPATLTVSIRDRRATLFELVWTAPSINGQPATGYKIRYAKVPITAANFDDTSITTAASYIGTPASPGQADGTTIKLYIENGYYFAVQGTNASGTGTLEATTAATIAHFNQTIVNSPAGTNEVFGASSDGSGDVNGDQISDILVGTSSGSRAYLFLGSATFAAGAPSVTFSSATDVLFGTGVAQIGDIDGDGLQDIAVADLSISAIYIYKGRKTWPMTLTDLQADYVISTTGNWTSASPGSSMARLGDFNGDGIDDFVIGGPTDATRVGRVAVIYGSKPFTNLSLPNATRTLEIGGDATLNRTQFGLRVVGLGHFYTVMTGTTLVVSAPGLGAATSTSDNQGHLYAFHGRAPGAAIDTTAADNVLVGPGKGAELGQVLMNLGPIVNSLPSVGAGNGLDTLSVSGASGTGFVMWGSNAAGPFASSTFLYEPSATQFGQMLFGGGTSGKDGSLSLIGSAAPDVGIVGTGGSIGIVDGTALTGLTSPINVATAAAVEVPLPTGWSSTTVNSGGLIPDINHDGYPDFMLADTTGATPGRIVVFW
jgi:hypothetical protein